MEEYDEINWLYEVLYASHNEQMLEDEFIKQHIDILNKSKSILDASCGNGIQAIALAKNGYDVTASDISSKMIALTKNKAEENGLKIETMISSWQQLHNYNKHFDIVFCYGNSISHSLTDKERIANIKALSKCLKKNGILVLDTRNWEKVKESKYQIYGERKYKGKNYIPIYIWDINENNGESKVTIIFIEAENTKLQVYEKKLTFGYFTHKELVNEINEIGLVIIKDTYSEGVSDYFLYLKSST